MRTILLFTALLFLFFGSIPAQSPIPDHAWIGTGRVSARINANGPLVTDFLVPNEDGDGDSLISTVGQIAIWMGAVDPAGNLGLAIQRSDTAMSDFQGGFRNLPASAGVWKVTKAEIDQHIQDFEADGDVDVVIPSIFSWPGRGNPLSSQLNGFSLDTFSINITAPFVDINFNGLYEPNLGEYPSIGYIIHNTERQPGEIVYMPFHNKDNAVTAPDQTLHRLNCNVVFFSYDCDDATFLEDAVFGSITFQYLGPERLDSLFLAFYVDGNIGNADDDYLGTLNNSLFFYNSDGSDENGFESHPPLFGFTVLTGLLDSFGTSQNVNSIIPIYTVSDNKPPGTLEPVLPAEYYNYITGRWRDGSPLQEGGTGYQSGGPPVSHIYPGNPGLPGEWSELSEGNLSGDRRAVLSSGPATAKPNTINRMLFSLNNVSGTEPGEQVGTLKKYGSTQSFFFYADFFPPAVSPFDSIPCLNTTVSGEPSDAVAGLIFPNPARTHVTVRTETPDLQQVVMFDALGRIVTLRENLPAGTQEIMLPLTGLTSGFYWLRWVMRDGKHGGGKITVAR